MNIKSVFQGLAGLSIVGFFFALFRSYVNITSFIDLSKAGIPFYSDYISPNTYFYVMFALFLLGNLPFFILSRLLNKLPTKLLPSPRHAFWQQDSVHQGGLWRIYKNWCYVMMAALNLLLMALAVNIMIENHIDGNVPIDYAWMYPLGLVAIGLTILLPVLRLSIPKLSLLESAE